MKSFPQYAFISLLIIWIISCSTQRQKDDPPQYVLDKHLQFSQYTDPGNYADLYDELPESFNELSILVKKQLIHPFDVEKYSDEIPEDRKFEDRDFPTVSLMLEELLIRDKNGIVASRKPKDRLVVACVHHNMLFASILRNHGIPVRIRAGYAKYIGDRKDLRVSHVICEVWDKKRSKWILIDPDRQKVDFPRNEFEFASKTWFLLRKGNLGDEKYISRYENVDQVTVHLLCHDLSYVIGTEESYWKDPPIVSNIKTGIPDLPESKMRILDKIAGYLKDPDNHLRNLVRIQAENSFLHFKEDM